MSQHPAQVSTRSCRETTLLPSAGRATGVWGEAGVTCPHSQGEGQEGSQAGRAEIRFSLLKLPWATGQRATGGQEEQAGLRRAQQPREQLGKGVPAPGRISARRT